MTLMTAKKNDVTKSEFCRPFGFYWQGRICEEQGKKQGAISSYETLMELRKNGDEQLPKRKDAIRRLARLKKVS